MNVDTSVIGYFFSASPIVKFVMLILFSASIYSWVLIFQRGFFLRWIRANLHTFEHRFNSTNNLTDLYNELAEKDDLEGMETIFVTGFKEFVRLQKRSDISAAEIVNGVERAMHLAILQLEESLENHLSFLATIGSTSPYIGLFGTVWGIMAAFHALGHVEQATIAMVAPGISEALVATAMGLFAAIPAVIAYNRYLSSVERVLNRYDAFQERFLGLIFRQVSLKKVED